ncbi:MAG: hypothetical protein LBG43_06290 [Treponema sp.]|nr:hypothetical protein [Treponema sp.]
MQSAPTYSPAKIVTTLRSIIAKKTFEKHSDIKNNCGEGNTEGRYTRLRKTRGGKQSALFD